MFCVRTQVNTGACTGYCTDVLIYMCLYSEKNASQSTSHTEKKSDLSKNIT